MSNEEIIEAVKRHQSRPYFHPLTCAVSSHHEILEAIERDKRVVLRCPTCGWIQEWIPEFVLDAPPDLPLDYPFGSK